MTNHVPSLITCQNLKEAGFPQETEFYWWADADDPDVYDRFVMSDSVEIYKKFHEVDDGWNHQKLCAAPILTEILEQLPKTIEKTYLTKRTQREYRCLFHLKFGFNQNGLPAAWYGTFNHKYLANVFGETPAEAAALLWIDLHKTDSPLATK